MSNTLSSTGSNSAAPFNSLLLTDANYITTASFGASATTASSNPLNFQVATPYPTTANVIAYVNWTNTSASSGSIYLVLQESADTVTWTPCANLANPIVSTLGSVSAGNVSVGLQPSQKQYLRVSAIANAGAAATGSVTLSALM
jgi:hypothetical protein